MGSEYTTEFTESHDLHTCWEHLPPGPLESGHPSVMKMCYPSEVQCTGYITWKHTSKTQTTFNSFTILNIACGHGGVWISSSHRREHPEKTDYGVPLRVGLVCSTSVYTKEHPTCAHRTSGNGTLKRHLKVWPSKPCPDGPQKSEATSGAETQNTHGSSTQKKSDSEASSDDSIHLRTRLAIKTMQGFLYRTDSSTPRNKTVLRSQNLH